MDKYEVFSNLSKETLDIYKKYYQRHKYKIILDEDNIIIFKKVNKNKHLNQELEKQILSFIKSILLQYKYEYKTLYIDYSELLNKLSNYDDTKLNGAMRILIKNKMIEEISKTRHYW